MLDYVAAFKWSNEKTSWAVRHGLGLRAGEVGLAPLVVAIDELRGCGFCASKESRADRFAYSDDIRSLKWRY